MIDIFIEECDDNALHVFFVQLGCVYTCTYNTLYTLCENIVSLYTEYNKTKEGDIAYQYLPINVYNRLYKSNCTCIYTTETDENISYNIKKICS